MNTNRRFLPLVSLIVPALIFFAHSLLFWNWIVDDAGISFAYSRNLAQGYGLVSQPGMPPVEGYSNFLWVLLLAPFFLLGIFEPVLTPKILSMLLITGSFYVVARTFWDTKQFRWEVLFSLAMVSLNTSFVIWAGSGLENPLFVFLICLLYFIIFKAVSSCAFSNLTQFTLGCLAAAIALTRPDGIIYAAAYPLAFLAIFIIKQYRLNQFNFRDIIVYLISFISIYGAYFSFRVIYFRDYFPNTYYAKGDHTFQNMIYLTVGFLGAFVTAIALVKLIQRKNGLRGPVFFLSMIFASVMFYFLPNTSKELFNSIAGPLGILVYAFLFAATLDLVATKAVKQEYFLLLIMTFLALFAYSALPKDWMGEYRFATPFYIFFFLFTSFSFSAFIKNLKFKHYRLFFTITAALCVVLSSWQYYYRSVYFSEYPALSFKSVSYIASQFNYFSEKLDISGGSILTPDLGGQLFYSKLKVYDSAMLCDKTIAKTLGKDQQAYFDYVFETVKPTFINTKGPWTYLSDFDKDERFHRDYLPIYEHQDDYIKTTYGIQMFSGRYVRKDVLKEDLTVLKELQMDHTKR